VVDLDPEGGRFGVRLRVDAPRKRGPLSQASLAVAIVTTPPPVTPTATYVTENSQTPTLTPVPPSTGVEVGSSASPATLVP
jgi:hypothetical protein